MAKILTMGDSPYLKSGYAGILRKVNQGLVDAGHDIMCLGWYQVQPRHEEEFEYKVQPCDEHDPYGYGKFNKIIYQWEPDIVFSVGDVYAIDWVRMSVLRDRFAFCFYVPIDSHPIPKMWYPALRDTDKMIGYTYYSQDRMLEELNIHIPVVYPGYDDKVFTKLDLNKSQLKERNNMTGRFVISYVGVNATRKQPVRLLEAFTKVKKKHPEAMLYMHTQLTNFKEGWNLHEAAMQLGIKAGDVLFSMQSGPFGAPEEQVNLIYNTSDIMASAAQCEGFGLPILEAAAVGTPSVGINYSAVPELIEGRGELVRPIAWTMHLPYCQQRPLIDTDSFAAKINKLIEKPILLQKYSQTCEEWAKQYTWDKQVPKFVEEILSTEKKAKRTGLLSKEVELISV